MRALLSKAVMRVVWQAHIAVEKIVLVKVGGGDQLPKTSLTFGEGIECDHLDLLLFA